MAFALVAVGGALGALARYGCLLLFPTHAMVTILLVNGIGSLSIGFLYQANVTPVWLFVGVGFCGALTTFSTFSLDTVKLLQSGQWVSALALVLGMNAVCVLACLSGLLLRRLIG